MDEDLVDSAREHLAVAGVGNVEVVLGDGALGHPTDAPYNKAIATVGTFETPTAWLEQLAPGGRLVVPLRLRGTVSRSIIFERGEDCWHSVGSELAVFMPLRGIGDDARRTVTLTPEEDVTLQVHKDQTVDGQALAGVLDTERHALEPLVNLARLHIRDGNDGKAFQLLDCLYEAVTLRTDIVIDGLPVPASTLTSSPDDHRELRQWLWTVHLADGARALTSAGRWQEALTHLQRHKGIGRRMLDGRQVAVIARATAGDADGALALLGDTDSGEPWENAVTACLTALCRRYADQPVDQDLAAMLDRYRKLDPTPQLAVFHTRLGLSAIDAAGGVKHSAARRIAADLIYRTTASRDGYVARDVLARKGCASLLTGHQAHDPAEVVNACALGRCTIPAGLRADLSAALATSEAVLARTLTAYPANADSAQ